MRLGLTTAYHALFAALALSGVSAYADDSAILRDIRGFFAASDSGQREEIVRRIESDPAYSEGQLTQWLHAAGLFEAQTPGRFRFQVKIDAQYGLRVAVRVPAEYDHTRPYPLIYALHGTGGDGDGIVNYVERLLGDQIDNYIVAAPTGYRQALVHSTTPPAREHPAILREIKRRTHIDSDRVYAFGYSRGGHTAWSLAVLHSDEFAGVAPVAGTLLLFEHGKLFETFLPNLVNTHVLASWGAGDVMSEDLVTRSADGGIAGLNRQLCSLAASLELPVKWYEDPDKGHGGVEPPRKDLVELLAHTREHYSRNIRHVFRLPYQGRTSWIEAHAWRGGWWDQQPLKISFRSGENPDDPDVQHEAMARAVRSQLGELRGEIDGQEIKVYRKKISELTVWIPEPLVDLGQPVVLTVNGHKAFEGKLEPDLFVAMSQAARTYDFDRLRWAGLRFKSGSRTKPVTGLTPFLDAPATPE